MIICNIIKYPELSKTALSTFNNKSPPLYYLCVMRIVADHKIPWLKEIFSQDELLLKPGQEIQTADLQEADVLWVRTRTRCNAELLANTSVKLILSATIGLDHIDQEWCTKQGISVHGAPGCNAPAVAHYVFAIIDDWLHTSKKHKDIESLKLGVIGAGEVGSRVAKVAEYMGWELRICDPPRERQESEHHNIKTKKYFYELGEVLSWADIITLHTPLNKGGLDNSYHLLSTREFQQIKANALLINSSRGEVIDSSALVPFLHSQELTCSFDVWEQEPNPKPAVIAMTQKATPHIAGYSKEGKWKATALNLKELNTYFQTSYTMPPCPPPQQKLPFSYKKEQSKAKNILRLCRELFNPSALDLQLKERPDLFEQIRMQYILRHQAGAYPRPQEIPEEVWTAL
jgi:erythronate-4-phosphate dehydrogenase